MTTINQETLESGILIVDDEHNILKALRRLLKRHGFTTVNTALNAEQGLTIIQNAEKPFAVILSDQNMPGMNGYAFFNKVMNLCPDSRRILMTGYHDFDAVMDAINQGGIHKYINKPWDDPDLLAMMTQEIEIYHSIHEKRRIQVIIKNQNAQLYQLAKQKTLEKKAFKKQETAKKEQLASIKNALDQLKKEEAVEKMLPGLDYFFSDKQIQDQVILIRAFEIINHEIETILGSMAQKHNLPYFSHWDHSGTSEGPSPMESPDYDLIDQIIGVALQNAIPLLSNLDPSFGDGVDIESYTTVPDLWELAQNEGLVEAEQILKLKEQIENRTDLSPSQRTPENILHTSGTLSRLDVSRLVVKRRFIQARVLDKIEAGKLVDQKLISSGALEICLSEQMKRFKDNGECIPVRDLLLEKNMIDRHTWKTMFEDAAEADEIPAAEQTPETRNLSEDDIPIELIVSNHATKAWIKNKKPLLEDIDTTIVKALLEKRGVISGIISDEKISKRLRTHLSGGDKWIVAETPITQPETDGKIEYFFNTQDRSPGIFKEDGTIDFKDRGDIPFVKKGALLAKKILWEQPHAVPNVLGEQIRLEPLKSVTLKAGTGTMLSEDGFALYATDEGEPCLDNRGIVSIYQELIIKNDVGFETGHVDFEGNVFVHGNIKDGFKVSCANLTVSEINGGIISITKDLKVSKGITNAQVTTQGNITTQFINKSKIKALGNMTVTREIMESSISINGQFLNTEGRILSSTIGAKMGLFVRLVGTEKSEPSILKPGRNDYLNEIKDELFKKENKIRSLIMKLTQKKKDLEEQNLNIHEKIMVQSCSCETLKKNAKKLQAQVPHITKNKKVHLKEEYNEAVFRLKTAEKTIRTLFNTQDDLVAQIEIYQENIQKALNDQAEITEQKMEIDQLKSLENGVPKVRISKHIQAGTRIIGPDSAMNVQHNTGACNIVEVTKYYGNIPAGKEMAIQNF
ncbi:FapA family protein [uncultured Desulfobacter sp.]|uniref:FapA family protein n=1 Tax=uncultured Desulfobacter sp. TaxID=240139 RepID=UPI0029F54E25|nr:FapA family protein [uncultured Desulfobacter sp.]